MGGYLVRVCLYNALLCDPVMGEGCQPCRSKSFIFYVFLTQLLNTELLPEDINNFEICKSRIVNWLNIVILICLTTLKADITVLNVKNKIYLLLLCYFLQQEVTSVGVGAVENIPCG